MVEYNPLHGARDDFFTLANVTNQMVEIIKSPELKDVDIMVLPEAAFNSKFSAILLPNSTVFCDDPNAHFLFRNISCAARTGKKYVVINVSTKVHCAVDDQPNCANKGDRTNLYNMAIVFDRQGAAIARYVMGSDYISNIRSIKCNGVGLGIIFFNWVVVMEFFSKQWFSLFQIGRFKNSITWLI